MINMYAVICGTDVVEITDDWGCALATAEAYGGCVLYMEI